MSGLGRCDVADWRPIVAIRFRPNAPRRQLVGSTAFRFPWPLLLHCLRHLGRAATRAFSFRSLYLSLLFAGIIRAFRPGLVRRQTNLDARLGHRRRPDPLGPRRFSRHLLLLPRRLLQSVLGRSSVLRRRRTAQILPGRALLSADPPEYPPLLFVSRADFSFAARA